MQSVITIMIIKDKDITMQVLIIQKDHAQPSLWEGEEARRQQETGNRNKVMAHGLCGDI